jgi:hypothetical protein
VSEDVTLQHGTEEFYRATVQVTKAGRKYNPMGDDVFFAFLPRGGTWDEGLWTAGEWEDYDEATNTATAMVLIGASGLDLDVGVYYAYSRIVDDPEKPKDILGVLRVAGPPAAR